MLLTMEKIQDEDLSILAEGLIDLAAGTWTCTEHGTVMDITTGQDCPKCVAHRCSARAAESSPG